MESDGSQKPTTTFDGSSAEKHALVPSSRVSRVMAKPGATAVTLEDLHEQLRSIRGLPTLWEAVERLFRLQPDEVVVMPLSLLRECQREAGPAPAYVKGIVGLRDVFLIHHRCGGPRPAPLPEPVVRYLAPAACDACGAQSLSHFYSSRELHRTLCSACYQLRTAPSAPSSSLLAGPAPTKLLSHRTAGPAGIQNEEQPS
jgi:hypothetical protein